MCTDTVTLLFFHPSLPPSFRPVLATACPSPVCTPSTSKETCSFTPWRATARQLSYTWRWEQRCPPTHTLTVSPVFTYERSVILIRPLLALLRQCTGFLIKHRWNVVGEPNEKHLGFDSRLISFLLLCLTGLVLRVRGETSCFQPVSLTALPDNHRGWWLVHAQQGSKETGQLWEVSVMVGRGRKWRTLLNKKD